MYIKFYQNPLQCTLKLPKRTLVYINFTKTNFSEDNNVQKN